MNGRLLATDGEVPPQHGRYLQRLKNLPQGFLDGCGSGGAGAVPGAEVALGLLSGTIGGCAAALLSRAGAAGSAAFEGSAASSAASGF
jgi:hypothetical protein